MFFSVKWKIWISLLLLASSLCFCEKFRTHKAYIVSIPGESIEEKSVNVGVNDSLAVFLPTDMTFLYGLEINVRIPSSIFEWRDSVACSVYDSISPKPTDKTIDYTGNRFFVSPLPTKANWIMQIPLSENNLIKESAYITKTKVVPSVAGGFVLVRFQPVMKGVPEEALNSILNVSVKPLVFEKGRFFLRVMADGTEFNDYQIFIDDKQAELQNGSIILDSGMHSVSIQSNEYRHEVRSVFIETAKKTECVVELKSLEPLVLITSPDNTEIYLDDELLENPKAEFPISDGEHKFRFVIGGYEIVRTITAEKGKTYNLNLSVDLQITEE